MEEAIEVYKELRKHYSLEPWMRELAEFVIEAHKQNKMLFCCYQQLTFEPLQLMKYLIEGRFVWGVVNWEMVDRQIEAK